MSNIMDNFNIDVTSRSFEDLKTIFTLLRWDKAEGYRTRMSPDNGTEQLILFWAVSDRPETAVSKLPFKMGRAAYTDFVWAWLQQVEFGPQPDIDGSCAKGFRVFTNYWGFVEGEGHYSFVAIEPMWAMIGK